MKLVPLFGVLAIPLSFALVACGGDDAGAGSGPTSTTTSTSSAGTGSGATGSTTSATSTGTTVTAGAGGSTGAGGSGAGSGGGGSTGAGGGAAGSGAGGSAGGATDGGRSGDASGSSMMNFFVSSSTSTTANLGGLSGADQRCQQLAAAVGQGGKTWHAYLSATNPPTNARDRIGEGPYYNAAGAMLAATKDALHARNGDAALFITEQGMRVNGQWAGSPGPLEHDILTGSNIDGTRNANTCGDWTATTGTSQVGHSDGLGPGMSTADMYVHWSSSHTGQCGNTAPGGGAGRIYCFVAP
jgi:hypothetical protein